ncbi:MAG: undecaprenyl/decaprenyl-phosphate alpha-N-acetylglucosaminyl 1-phosphate transferase, partial [Acidobacteria bacterium]|nr:undecaprenyl/decaprenyl-phosphate alpha-N-acetylglucosaminyl 1-phosphate transferase [Acidobacteriota bacterium]
MSPFLLFVLAFGLSFVLVPPLRRVAFATGMVAHPAADRWNRQAVPLLGGLALMAGVWVSVGVSQGAGRATLTVLGSATLLGLVGLFDDIRPLRPATKLAWQIIVAALVVTMDLRLGLSSIVLLDLGLTMLWLVALSNAFNLLDNMDGLAAGIAAIALGFRFVFLAGPGNTEAAVLVLALLGASLGFLVFNFAPARIFMGDAGSMFLGFAVAGTSLVGDWPYSRATSATVFLPLLLTVVPLFDATFVTVARTLAGRPVYMGGRDHTSHRLVALGLSERSAVLVLYLLATLGGATAYTSYRYGWSYGGVLSL